MIKNEVFCILTTINVFYIYSFHLGAIHKLCHPHRGGGGGFQKDDTRLWGEGGYQCTIKIR